MESRPILPRGQQDFVGGEPSSVCYFMDEPLVTEACGVVSDAENMDPWDLPHVITITSCIVEGRGENVC